ncbi:hypothetical protein C6P52_11930 [Enterococcus mundtii]|nr:hypothetical protein C6P52_11930 [Enterococcus mundtii]PTO44716.1 hypothetical protein C6P54_03420 [Enterococcus mundtii]
MKKNKLHRLSLHHLSNTRYASRIKKSSKQRCLASKNKAPSTKIVFHIFVDGALFSKKLLLFPPFIRF